MQTAIGEPVTPAARIQAAIEVLDRIKRGTPAEAALTNWARSGRYAGSGDRAAVRTHVFDALRRFYSASALGRGTDGRAVMIGILRLQGAPLGELFQGQGYGPAPMDQLERGYLRDPVSLTLSEKREMPEWLLPELDGSLGSDLDAVCDLLQTRAPVFLRVNLARATRDDVQAELADAGITANPHDLSPSALLIDGNPRGLKNLAALKEGRAELQDGASQAVVDFLDVQPGARVLDYCAGGGGKSLALAAKGTQVTAHDAIPRRMSDIPARARRAGVTIDLFDPEDLPTSAPFDLVLCDVPCSGSGAWRRSPAGKLSLTDDLLAELLETQAQILNDAKDYVTRAGTLAYVTCSLLNRENEEQIDTFLAVNPGWQVTAKRRISPLEGGDGFFVALLTRRDAQP